ncbi:hypothetical protein ACLOJK_024908 [Asimina triloba]
MPCFPPAGSLTICEINRDFRNLMLPISGAHFFLISWVVNLILGVQGAVFSPAPFQPELLLNNSEQESELGLRDNVPPRGLSSLHLILSDLFKRIFLPKDVNLSKVVDPHGVSWHQHKHILAFISGPNQVTIRDYEDSGNTASVRSGVTSLLGTLSRAGSGFRWTLVDFLQSPNGEQGAAWDPDGNMILLSFSDSMTLGSIHFASKPPSLDAHLLPVDLPEVESLTGRLD